MSFKEFAHRVNFFIGANQVDIFLEDHGGPGVQHMGLYTPDIMSTVATFKQSGAQFVQTPQAYYEDVSVYIYCSKHITIIMYICLVHYFSGFFGRK